MNISGCPGRHSGGQWREVSARLPEGLALLGTAVAVRPDETPDESNRLMSRVARTASTADWLAEAQRWELLWMS
jgi:hypothetical protein